MLDAAPGVRSHDDEIGLELLDPGEDLPPGTPVVRIDLAEGTVARTVSSF